jgi:hypothetical protein
MEDALKKLDKSTQEEARMVATHNLKATHTVDGRVRRVAITVEAINNTVARVDDRVVQVDDRVARVYDEVTGANTVIKHMANDVDRGKRSSSPTSSQLTIELYTSF